MVPQEGYQESKLNQAERSKSGAVGIMQMKPSTAREPDITIDRIENNPDCNIEAGNKYLVSSSPSTSIRPFSPLRPTMPARGSQEISR